MNLKKRKVKINFLSLSIIGIMMLGMLFTTVYASTTYQPTLEKGTEQYSVSIYNATAWKATVNSSGSPSEWFEGNSNVTDAQSKVTLQGWDYITWHTYDAFTSIFLPEFFSLGEIIFLLNNILKPINYNETTINANYTGDFHLWYGLQSVWNFTTGEFQEEPSYSKGILVLENPQDYKSILDNYNGLAMELNANPAIIFAGYNFPTLNADEFLWQLVLNGLAVAKPQSGYLTSIVSELGCENATASGSNLTIERHGETNYTVIISYGEEGTMSSFTVKDVGGNVIFNITSTNSEWVFFLMLIIIIAATIGIFAIAGILYKKGKER
jgi:hypothetical protein